MQELRIHLIHDFQALFDAIPPGLNPNVTGWLVYDSSAPKPKAKFVDEFNEYDDYKLVPQDRLERFEDVAQSITLSMVMANLGDGAN